MGTELAVLPSSIEIERQRFMPVMDMSLALERRTVIKKAIADLMKEDEDYGTIPGTGTKPTLLQPGAQKLDNLFGLVPRFEVIDKVEDWTGEQHGGEPFFRYMVRCTLYRGEFPMGEGLGECNSWESKYRWRTSERKCPACGAAAIIKGKDEYGGGWVCFKKKSGCGAKYADGDSRIEGQAVGRIPNADIFDQVNTLLKMSCKRGHVAGTINTTSASEFFTQDLEDRESHEAGSQAAANAVAANKLVAMNSGKEYTEVSSSDPKKTAIPDAPGGSAERPFTMASSIKAFTDLKGLMMARLGEELASKIYYRVLGYHGAQHCNELKTAKPARDCYKELAQAFDDELRSDAVEF